MVDFSRFSDNDFDVKKWINRSLSSSVAAQGTQVTDQLVSTLMMKIQLLSNDCHNAIDEICTQTLASMPRVLRDSERLASDSAALRSIVAGMQAKLDEIEGRSAQSVQELDQLDQAKTRMESCLHMLREASRFDARIARLREDVDAPALRPDALKGLAEKLGAVQNSLRVLQTIDTFKPRTVQVQQLQDDVAVKVKSQLEEALKERSSDRIRDMVELYQRLGRQAELQAMYVDGRRHIFSELFERHRRESTGEGAEAVVWLCDFFAELVSVVENELGWCAAITPDSADFIAELSHAALTPLAEPIRLELERIIGPKEGLPNLVKLFKAATDAAKSVRTMLSADSPSAALRGSVAVVTAFTPIQRRYCVLEQQRLQRESSKLIVRAPSFDETVRRLSDATSPIFAMLEAGLERCIVLTDGGEGRGTVKVFGSVVVDLVGSKHELLEHLTKNSGVGAEVDMEVKPGGEMVEPDWSLIQGAMQLHQQSRHFRVRLMAFDAMVRSKLRTRIGHLLESLDHADGSLSYLSTDRTRIEELRTFYKILRDTDVPVLDDALGASARWVSACERFVNACAVQSAVANLRALPSNPAWSIAELDDDMAFSLSPLPYASKLGELLLELPQQLELLVTEGASEDITAVSWLDGIANTAAQLYCARIVEIVTLTPAGRTQLQADVEYIANVLSALGVGRREHINTLHSLNDYLAASSEGGTEGTPDLPQLLAEWIGRLNSKPS